MDDSKDEGFGLAPMKIEGRYTVYELPYGMKYATILPAEERPLRKEEEPEYMELRVLPWADDARATIHAQVDEWLDDLYAGRRGI